MALKLDDKKIIVSEVREKAQVALSAVVAEYRGLTVVQLDGLRAKARDAGVYLRVVRNTLAIKAVEGTEFECMKNAFVGPLILAFSMDAPGEAAKLFKDFSQENDKLIVKNLAMAGELYGIEKLEEISKLPNLEQALSMLCNVMHAPVTKLVRTVNEIPSQAVRVFAAVGETK